MSPPTQSPTEKPGCHEKIIIFEEFLEYRIWNRIGGEI